MSDSFFSLVQLSLKLIGALISIVKTPITHQVQHVISPINNFFSFCHCYREDGGLYDEARGQKESTTGENIYS